MDGVSGTGVEGSIDFLVLDRVLRGELVTGVGVSWYLLEAAAFGGTKSLTLVPAVNMCVHSHNIIDYIYVAVYMYIHKIYLLL